MKSEVFIFFACFSFNIVASFNQYRQGAFPEWHNNQNYPQNTNRAYPAVNYGEPQLGVDYVQRPPEPDYAPVQEINFPEQKRIQESIYAQPQKQQLLQQQIQQQVLESQPGAFAKHSAVNVPETYPEPPYLPHSIPPGLPDRSYENYDHQPSLYNNHAPQVSNQWPSHNTYESVPPIPQESYSQPASYPNWQHSGYKAVQPQNPYDADTYVKENNYNPVQYTSNTQDRAGSHASTSYKNRKVQEILASKPNVKEYLASPDKKRYIVIHPNGTSEQVDFLDDDLLGKSHHFKSSDIQNILDYTKKITKNLHKNPVNQNTNNLDQNIHPSKLYENSKFLPHSLLKDKIKTSDPVPHKDHHSKNYYNREYEPIKKNNRNPDKGTIASVDKPITLNKYRHNPYNKPTPHETAVVNSPNAWNRNNNYRNPEVEKPNFVDERRDDVPLIQENLKKNHKNFLNHPTKRNPENSFIPFTTEAVEPFVNRNPTYDYPLTKKGNKYYPSEPIYSKAPSSVQNSNEDTMLPAEYNDAPAPDTNDSKPIDASNEILDEPKESDFPYRFQYPPKTDEGFNKPTFKPPNPSDYKTSDNPDQSQESNTDDTSSNDQRYPQDSNPIDEVPYNDEVPSVSSLEAQPDKSDDENIDVSEDNNEDTVTEVEPNLTDAQDTSNKTDCDKDDTNTIVDPVSNESFNSSSTTAAEITTLSPVESESSLIEDSSTDIEESVNEEEPEQPEIVDLKEKVEPESEPDTSEVDVEFLDTLDSENTEKYDEVYYFDLKLFDTYIERTSRTYMTKTNITVEDTEEIVYEHKGDEVPIKITTTKVIWNPGPGYSRSKKIKLDKPQETSDEKASDCTT